MSLKLKDFSKIAPIVQQLADTDVTENQSISYTLEDMDAAKTRAVEDAYRRAHESANLSERKDEVIGSVQRDAKESEHG